MQTHKLIPVLKWTIITLLASAVFAPLLVWLKYLFPFITTKTLFFRLMVEVAISALLTYIYVSVKLMLVKLTVFSEQSGTAVFCYEKFCVY